MVGNARKVQSMNRCVNVVVGLLIGVAILLCGVLPGESLYAQSGLRESLERLDTNKDGNIDPGEITPLARPYLERLSRTGSDYRSRLSLDRPNEISKLQELARRYYATQNGVDGRQDVRPGGESKVLPFGRKPDEPLVPEFGLAEVKYAYTQDDLDFADRTMGDYDRNEDGYIDREEADRARKWTHRNPFDDDLNKDNRLSRQELTQRYARRRLLDGASDELRRKSWRTGGEVRPSSRDDQRRKESDWWRKGGSNAWLTASVLGRFDANRNGRLEQAETQNLGLPISQIDIDRDGELSREELQKYLMALQDEAGGDTEALPSWFYELDENRDGQVAMSEFANEWTNEKLQEFAALDTNGDALLTSAEVIQSKALVGGSYGNHDAQVLPPRKTIISEIEVSEDYLVGDLNVQLSITHSHDSHLDAYLTGPDGQRIELFTEIGGSGDNFDQTSFDDQSRSPINKARSPFRGAYIPEGLLNKQPGLSHFNGKSVAGVWQLVVRGTRSDRFGMLHGWSLIVKPQGDGLAAAPPVSTSGGSPPGRTSSPATSSVRTTDRLKSVTPQVQWKTDAREKAIERYKFLIESRKLDKNDLSKIKELFKVRENSEGKGNSEGEGNSEERKSYGSRRPPRR